MLLLLFADDHHYQPTTHHPQIHELETTVCDYDANQDVLQTRMCVHAPLLQQQQHAIFHSNQLVEGLQTLATQRDAVDMQVPMELLRYLDDGGNPDSFTTEVFSRAQADNQQAKGRVDALRCAMVVLRSTHHHIHTYPQQAARHAGAALGRRGSRRCQPTAESRTRHIALMM